jgi:hypothetical protein
LSVKSESDDISNFYYCCILKGPVTFLRTADLRSDAILETSALFAVKSIKFGGSTSTSFIGSESTSFASLVGGVSEILSTDFFRFLGGELLCIISVDVMEVVRGYSVILKLSASFEVSEGLVLVWSIEPLSRFYLIRSRAAEPPSLALPRFRSKCSRGLTSSPSSSSRSRSSAREIRLRGLADGCELSNLVVEGGCTGYYYVGGFTVVGGRTGG